MPLPPALCADPAQGILSALTPHNMHNVAKQLSVCITDAAALYSFTSQVGWLVPANAHAPAQSKVTASMLVAQSSRTTY